MRETISRTPTFRKLFSSKEKNKEIQREEGGGAKIVKSKSTKCMLNLVVKKDIRQTEISICQNKKKETSLTFLL